MNPELKAAVERRMEDEEHAKRLNALFAESKDLFAYCPKCGNRIGGSMDNLKSHVAACRGLRDLIGEDDGSGRWLSQS